jgi:hypothetical protein
MDLVDGHALIGQVKHLVVQVGVEVTLGPQHHPEIEEIDRDWCRRRRLLGLTLIDDGRGTTSGPIPA